MAIKRSLHLDGRWDIHLAPSGDIQTTTGTYCDAQNVANAIRLFTKDAYLAQRKGVPHFAIDLGVMPSPSEVRHEYRRAAREVENIVDATVELDPIDPETRTLTGVISVTNEQGGTAAVEI